MRLGVDLSIMDEQASNHPVFYYEGKPIEPFSFFAKHSGISLVRLRLWHDPFDEEGNPYGGGTNDLACFLRLAKKAQENGMGILLDFHYSDFWVDPSRQLLPKAWAKLSFSELVKAVYDYTKETLLRISSESIDLAAIQVGNEISNGMLHPFGDVWKTYSPEHGGGFEGHAMLLKAGLQACKEVFPNAKRLIHLEHSGSFDMQDTYFGEMVKHGVDFDAIGESYYPYWHGGFPCFEDNVTKLMAKYRKPIWVVEMGYEFMKSKIEGHHSGFDEGAEEDFIVGNINGRVPFEGSKRGQADYLKSFLGLCKRIGVEMVCYWEPCWTDMSVGWAKDAGQRYVGLVPTKASNDWANECLFDEENNANPAVDVFTQSFVDKL